jgi:hypothetical protein
MLKLNSYQPVGLLIPRYLPLKYPKIRDRVGVVWTALKISEGQVVEVGGLVRFTSV